MRGFKTFKEHSEILKVQLSYCFKLVVVKTFLGHEMYGLVLKTAKVCMKHKKG